MGTGLDVIIRVSKVDVIPSPHALPPGTSGGYRGQVGAVRPVPPGFRQSGMGRRNGAGTTSTTPREANRGDSGGSYSPAVDNDTWAFDRDTTPPTEPVALTPQVQFCHAAASGLTASADSRRITGVRIVPGRKRARSTCRRTGRHAAGGPGRGRDGASGSIAGRHGHMDAQEHTARPSACWATTAPPMSQTGSGDDSIARATGRHATLALAAGHRAGERISALRDSGVPDPRPWRPAGDQ